MDEESEGMGTFYVSCSVKGHSRGCKPVQVRKLLVDTGSDYTWILETRLRKAGVKPVKKDEQFLMANGQTVTRNVGFAIVQVLDRITTDEVVFGQKGDLELLGARTLEGLNLRVDSRRKKLVAGGPHLVA